MTAPDLLPCPCGGKVHIDHFKNPSAVVVVCEKCGTDWLGYWSDSEQSIAERWNTRATPAPAAMPPEVPTEAQVRSACLSYRHDFGLLDTQEQERVMFQAREWLHAWRKELSAALRAGGE